ncbi:MAG: DUF2752 domain-containing protein [Ignavibacteria bacterium]
MRLSKIFENKKFKAAVIIFVTAACLLTLYLLNPAVYTYHPPCYLYLLTGKLCPGCGGMRGMHQLLHGNLNEAFKLNLLLILFIPFGVYYLLSQFSILIFNKSFPDLISIKYIFYPVLFIVVLYWILRNL